MTMRVLVAASMLGALLLACNQSFDPRAPLDQEMVVFSVLSTDRQVQFVRVQQSYMSPTYDATSYTSDNSVTDAIVSIRASNGLYFLTDTLLARTDTSRYKFPLRAFVLNPFIPRWGESYQVIVQSLLYGVATATVVVPGRFDDSTFGLYGTGTRSPGQIFTRHSNKHHRADVRCFQGLRRSASSVPMTYLKGQGG